MAEAAHSPGAYADALVRIAGDASVQHRRRGALDLAGTLSRTLAELMGPDDLRRVAPGMARGVADLFGPPVQGVPASAVAAGEFS